MKKIGVIILIALLASCSNNSQKNNVIQPTAESAVVIGVKEEEIDYATLIPETKKLSEEIKEKYLFYPTDICIDYSAMTLRWIADCGIGIDFDLYTELDQEYFVKLERSIYKGKLTKIAENCFSSKGEFMPTMLSVNKPISDEVDFYIVVEDNKLFVILDAIDQDELVDYQSDSYYYAH